MTHVRRAVFRVAGSPLEMWDVEVPRAPAGGMTVRVEVAGVCGTDAHRLSGDVASTSVPVAFGHEAVGRVLELGSGTHTDTVGSELSAGDWVYWSPAAGCGRCFYCSVQGASSGCNVREWPPRADVPSAAGFQDIATLPESAEVIRIPDEVSPESLVALGCALPTALGGLERLGPLRPHHVVVVQGAGAVGLAATALAVSSGVKEVIVIGDPPPRLAAAERFGATLALSVSGSSAEERERTIRHVTGGRGVDVVIEATGNRLAFAEGIALLGHNGTYLIMGLYSGDGRVQLDAVRLNNLNLRVIGSFGAPSAVRARVDAVAVVEQLQRRRIFVSDLITHRFGLHQLEQAIEVTRSGEAIKAVVTPASNDGGLSPAKAFGSG